MSVFTPTSEENLIHFMRLQHQHALLSNQAPTMSPTSVLPPLSIPQPSRRSSLISNPDDNDHFTVSPSSSSPTTPDPRRLSEVNEEIKRTLTALLNCADIRSDNERRMWVQSRLMAAERELRSGRRRRSGHSVEA